MTQGPGRVAACVALLSVLCAGQARFDYLRKYQFDPTLPSAGFGSVRILDYDEDGDADIIVDATSVFRNDGNSRFQPVPVFPPPCEGCALLTNVATSGDIDGDGDLDFVLALLYFPPFSTLSQVAYLGDGRGNFVVAPGRLPQYLNEAQRHLALGDMDGDGDLDLVVANFGVQNRLYLNDGTGTFADATIARLPVDTDHSVRVELVDLDADLDLDIVFANGGVTQTGVVEPDRVYLNTPSGFVEAASALSDVEHSTDLAVGDVDGDGDADVVITNWWDSPTRSLGRVFLYLNDGNAGFQDESVRLPTGTAQWKSCSLGDLDLDGDLDLVLGRWDFGAANVVYLENDGTAQFTDRTAAMPARDNPVEELDLGDLDGDQDLDIAIVNNGVSPRDPRSKVYTNLQRQLYARNDPRLGQLYDVAVHASAGDIAVPMIGLGGATIPLPVLGTLGLDPLMMVTLPAMVVPESGPARVSFRIPNDTSLVEQSWEMYSQALVFDSTPAARHRLTNVMREPFQR